MKVLITKDIKENNQEKLVNQLISSLGCNYLKFKIENLSHKETKAGNISFEWDLNLVNKLTEEPTQTKDEFIKKAMDLLNPLFKNKETKTATETEEVQTEFSI